MMLKQRIISGRGLHCDAGHNRQAGCVTAITKKRKSGQGGEPLVVQGEPSAAPPDPGLE